MPEMCQYIYKKPITQNIQIHKGSATYIRQRSRPTVKKTEVQTLAATRYLQALPKHPRLLNADFARTGKNDSSPLTITSVDCYMQKTGMTRGSNIFYFI
jgi:hypothetical protein